MRKQYLKKIILCTLILGSVMVMCACRKISTDTNRRESHKVEKTIQKQNANGIEQFAEEVGLGAWEDHFVVNGVDYKGEAFQTTVNLLANVLTPKVDSMAVLKVEKMSFDEGLKKEFCDSFFQSTYLFGNEYLTKEELDQAYNNAKKELEYIERVCSEQPPDYYDPLDEQEKAYWKSQMEHYQKCGASLKGTDVLADNFLSDSYHGEWNGEDYTLSFVRAEDQMTEDSFCSFWGYNNEIILERRDKKSIVPEELQDAENVEYGWNEIDNVEIKKRNYAGIKQEEARELAQEFISEHETNPLMLDKENLICWEAVGDEDLQSDIRIDGYVFRFRLSADGLAVGGEMEMLKVPHSVWFSYMNAYRDMSSFYSPDYYVDVFVKDEGVVRVVWHNPITVISVTDNVRLLQMDSVKEMTKQAIKDTILQMGATEEDIKVEEEYTISGTMALGYIRVSDETNGMYSYVPAWMLTGVPEIILFDNEKTRGAVVVNAIDGNEIDLIDEWIEK